MAGDVSPVTIEQITGEKRVMVFKGRSLPYQGLPLGIEIRTKQTWLPANPVSNQQVLGSTRPNTVIRGMWKDRYLVQGENSVQLIQFPQISGGGLPQSGVSSGGSFATTNTFPGVQQAQLSRVVVDALDLMASEQQKVRFQWDQYVRYGIIKRFIPTWIRINDVEWELEFEWSGTTEFSPVKRVVEYNALSTAAGLAQLLSAIRAILAALFSLRTPNRWFSRVVGPIFAIADLVIAIIEGLRSIVSIATAPADLLSVIRGQLALIKLAARGLMNDLRKIRSARGEAALVGSPADVAIAALVEQGLREQMQELAAFAAAQQRLLAVFGSQEILATFYADSFTSLRDVSTQFYGEPGQWTRISNFNGFFSDTVAKGSLVRVPAVS